VFTESRGQFAEVKNSRVLIYWPHGFGDWVHLSYLLPLLESSNRYWITRFGDHNTALYDGSPYVSPIYMGVQSLACGSGEDYRLKHLELDYASIDGGSRVLRLPFSVARVCERNEIDTVLWSNYPEVAGRRSFPHHTKIRSFISTLLGDQAARADLNYPLNCAIAFEPPAWVLSWVEARLQTYAGFRNRRLCLIGRTGYTSLGKNWGHRWREDLPQGKQREGEECRDFMRLLRRRDPRWMFLSIEDQSHIGYDSVRSRDLHCYSYADLFGSIGHSQIPFALVLKALTSLSELAVGVPAGPYHLCMASGRVPTIGLWIEHFPSWFDEPSCASIHLISRNVQDRQLHRRCGSFASAGHLSFRCIWLPTRTIAGEDVLHAYESL
jgi:hypothetical protein